MKNIALVAGGYSGEKVVSLRSAAVVEENLDKTKFRVFKIVIDKSDWYYAENQNVKVDKNDFSLTISGEKIRFDCVFIIIHGAPGEDGKFQGYLDMLGLPYTSCDSITSALTFNKAFCNKVVKCSKLVNVAKSLHLFAKDNFTVDYIADYLGFPCFVKPNAGGSSIGMSKVLKKENLKMAIETAFKEDEQVLIEQFIQGREFTCGVIKTNKIIALPVTEVISKKDFFDYEAKYNPSLSEEITPANISPDLMQKIQDTAIKIFKILNCAGICRFDFIFDEKSNSLYFLEVNTVPGQSAQSIVPQQIRAAGMTVKDVYSMLIETVMYKN
ncbi:D-alanine--D-alanine ligase [Bacteroidia bacterium]|nr:D-alanine--D-alanine ligase [Bacteroidia bacterium]